jgi:hypothetical protein
MSQPSARLGLGVLQDYNKLRADTQGKNIAAWTPVVAEILEGFCRFDDKAVGYASLTGPAQPAELFLSGPVRTISTRNLPSSYRALGPGCCTRHQTGFTDVLRKSRIRAGHYRVSMIFNYRIPPAFQI